MSQNKVDNNIHELHFAGANAHTSTLAKRDAFNLNNKKQSWKTKLEVGNLPSNITAADDYDELGNISDFGNIYTRDQRNNMLMSYEEYTDKKEG